MSYTTTIHRAKSQDKIMEQSQNKHRLIEAGVKEAIALALAKHKRLGESIAVWKDGKVVVVPPEEIPSNSEELSFPKVCF
jgi:hypothetical protein